MNTYHAFLDAQERNYMTEAEKLEKRNSEIIMAYRTAGDKIYNRETSENMITKSQSVNITPEKNKKKFK